jgi:DNA excision repair protein ERCC-4
MARAKKSTAPIFVVAPTERDKHIHGLAGADGEVSMLPERYGCDVLWRAQGEWWGVQRKEIKDFLASIQDGRLAREVAMMKPLPVKVVTIEGRINYTTDGVLMVGNWTTAVTRQQLEGMIMSLMAKGIHTVWTDDTRDTARWIRSFATWSMKTRHGSLERRPGPVSPWGNINDDDWAVHFLQGIDGLGSEKARAIVHFFGAVPISWDCTESELMQVPGIGKILARKMYNALSDL